MKLFGKGVENIESISKDSIHFMFYFPNTIPTEWLLLDSGETECGKSKYRLF